MEGTWEKSNSSAVEWAGNPRKVFFLKFEVGGGYKGKLEAYTKSPLLFDQRGKGGGKNWQNSNDSEIQ